MNSLIKKTATADVKFKAKFNSNGLEQSVFRSDKKYWSDKMKKALGIGNFPQSLDVNNNQSLQISAVSFNQSAPSLKKIFNNDVKIYVTPDWFFLVKFREIFQRTKLPLDQSPGEKGVDEVKHWFYGPDMRYWPQQLNFVTWCATTGCGVTRELFDSDHTSLHIPKQIKSFFRFHVYFTIRRILYEMGGSQHIQALPDDTVFHQRWNML